MVEALHKILFHELTEKNVDAHLALIFQKYLAGSFTIGDSMIYLYLFVHFMNTIEFSFQLAGSAKFEGRVCLWQNMSYQFASYMLLFKLHCTLCVCMCLVSSAICNKTNKPFPAMDNYSLTPLTTDHEYQTLRSSQ